MEIEKQKSVILSLEGKFKGKGKVGGES